ncbi:WD40-repeat-containing domain [Pseudocohnilembus persalinus]|uniref:WD40-repeat-containing domain n=1 Tax=Pseudocohnilembus persalinus TaxID=266149 RepID=A0A0V0Q955_PSEPJ|nr:WD40-repeat-containing domain [Pseudocohnilembus persalinus]|eukprot:KRW98551.1 WD40-repeat-containing domain [Pseudocohnilembus persalinus]
MTEKTIKTTNTLVYVGMNFSKYFSTLLKTTSGRDKFLSLLQYMAQFYYSCAKHSTLDPVKEQFLKNALQSVRIAKIFEDSLSQARKTFRLLKFVDDAKAMAQALKTKKPWFFKLVQWVEAFFSFNYYLTDNILWIVSLLIQSKYYNHSAAKKWKNWKNRFSMWRINVGIFKLIWHLAIRQKKIIEMEQEIKNLEDKKVQKNDQAYELMKKYLKNKRKNRFDILNLIINVSRFFLLYKSLHYPLYKQLDPIFVSFNGLNQAALSLIKTIYEKRIFVQIESGSEKLPNNSNISQIQGQNSDLRNIHNQNYNQSHLGTFATRQKTWQNLLQNSQQFQSVQEIQQEDEENQQQNNEQKKQNINQENQDNLDEKQKQQLTKNNENGVQNEQCVGSSLSTIQGNSDQNQNQNQHQNNQNFEQQKRMRKQSSFEVGMLESEQNRKDDFFRENFLPENLNQQEIQQNNFQESGINLSISQEELENLLNYNIQLRNDIKNPEKDKNVYHLLQKQKERERKQKEQQKKEQEQNSLFNFGFMENSQKNNKEYDEQEQNDDLDEQNLYFKKFDEKLRKDGENINNKQFNQQQKFEQEKILKQQQLQQELKKQQILQQQNQNLGLDKNLIQFMSKKQTVQQKQFSNKIFKRSQLELQGIKIKDIQIMNTFQYQPLYESNENQMIVVLSQDNLIYIYDVTGYQIVDTYDPKMEVKLMTIGPKSDEYLINLLSNDNVVQVAKLSQKKILQKNNKSENNEVVLPRGKKGKQNERYRYPLKKDLEFSLDYGKFEEILGNQNQSENDGEYILKRVYAEDGTFVENYIFIQKKVSDEILQVKKQILMNYNYLCFQYITVKGYNYFLLGDDKGNIHSYHRNGTYHNTVNVSLDPIKQITKSISSNTLFVTQNHVGFYNPVKGEQVPPFCDQIYDGIQQVKFDQNFNNYLYILTEKQEIIVFEIRNQDKSCRFKHMFQSQFDEGKKLQMRSIKNSLMVMDPETNIMKVFNTTDINQQEDLESLEHSILYQIQQRNYDQDSDLFYQVNKGTGFTSYMVYAESGLNSTFFSFYEIKTPQRKDNSDFLNNLRYPLMILGIAGAAGYQYWKRKDKISGKKEKFTQQEAEQFEKMFSESGLGGFNKGLNKNEDSQFGNKLGKNNYLNSKKKEGGYSSSDSGKPRSILKSQGKYMGDSDFKKGKKSKFQQQYDSSSEEEIIQQKKSKNNNKYNQEEMEEEEEQIYTASTGKKFNKKDLEQLNKYKDTLNSLTQKTMDLGSSLEQIQSNRLINQQYDSNNNSYFEDEDEDLD